MAAVVIVGAGVLAWDRWGAAVPDAVAPGPAARAEKPGDDVPRINLSQLSQDRGQPLLGKRNIAEWGEEPTPPPTPPPASLPAPPPSASVATPPPTPPPLQVKYIGTLATQAGLKVAVFLTVDRKEILTGREGEVVGNRLRVVKIGLESVDVEDVGSGRVRRIPLRGN